jgi:hypothetical protein
MMASFALWLLLLAPSAAREARDVMLAPCNTSDAFQQWVFDDGGSVHNRGADLCLSTATRDPMSAGPCGAGAATFAYNATNLTLAVVRPSAGGAAAGAGDCVDAHGGDGPELDLWACHALPPSDCSRAGLCSGQRPVAATTFERF